ncbi:uncharacterized protein ACA1_382570 [Acanthamoeba castellanii str. Neff]|uniref:Uncharacterized protein n=1 Tax=Acanthamoeba castellanii (strain ATCC 30010 / Neff) TaxID=1257118 RepID=L8GV19_ACACF|nr:uncharacterized protein ACA1_382570 [Acanthamoeba castellanii str. Neff]ELR16777.1 hypothetical protein ACA1_382570 [Acanthamoeba castellanii str. Neff]
MAKWAVVSVVLVLALALYPLLRFTTVPYEHSVLIKAPRAKEEGDVLVYDVTEALPVFGRIVNNTVQVTRSFQVGKGYHHIDSEVKAYGLAQYLFSAKHRFTLQLTDTMWVTAPYVLVEHYIGPTAFSAHQALVRTLKQIMEDEQDREDELATH